MTTAGTPDAPLVPGSAATPSADAGAAGQATAVPEVLWQPDRERVARAAMTDFATFLGHRAGRAFHEHEQLWQYSVTELEAFWTAVADYFGVRWHASPQQVLERGDGVAGARWFTGGTLNYAEHALATGPGRSDDDVAVVVTDESWQDRAQRGDPAAVTQLTLGQLRTRVAAAQAGLRRAGVQPGDRVVALLPNGLHALVAFLATAACGAVWSSCSPDFGASSVVDRFSQIEPVVFLAVDGYRYNGKEFRTTDTVRTVREALPGLRATVLVEVLGGDRPDDVVDWESFTRPDRAASEVEFVPVPFGAPLWVLYSSGTTGLPKPIVQSVGGILLEHLKMLRLHHDLGPGDRFLWFTTTGWMMWNYLVSGLLVGSTVVLFDGSPGHPDLMTLWRLVSDLGVSFFGTSAPFVHSCRAEQLRPAAELDLSALQAIGSTGSPLTAAGFSWLADEIGAHVQICSVSGGTDLCTAVVGAAPTVPVWLGEISCRALGAAVESFDEQGRSQVDRVGELVITEPMPSMPVAFWGDDDGSRLRAAYFEDYPGVWRHGDWIRITPRGSCVIEGRSDATLNRGGVRMGTADFYRVVEDQPGVTDSLVIDTSGADGEGELLLFVVLDGSEDLSRVASRLRSTIRSELSPRHVPSAVIAVPAVPRTLNGKKVEVPVKRILAGTPVEQAVSRDALADPQALERFLAAARDGRAQGAAPGS